jgi:hypothetical protein
VRGEYFEFRREFGAVQGVPDKQPPNTKQKINNHENTKKKESTEKLPRNFRAFFFFRASVIFSGDSEKVLAWESKGRALPKVQTPPNRSPGAFRDSTRSVGATRASPLRCVLGGDPLMPVLLDRVLVVGSPEIGPEPCRFGLWRAASNDDP